MGKDAMQAALDGSRQVSFTIVSMTLSLVAVFIPVLFMGGIVGRLFRGFSATIAVAILACGAVSLTLTPMMASRLLRHSGERRHGRFYALTERLFQHAVGFYGWSLRKVIRVRGLVMVFSALVLAATGYLFVSSPKGFLPSEDTGRVQSATQAAQGIPFQSMVRHQGQVDAILQKDPNVESFMSAVGFGAGNMGRLSIRMKPRNERPLSADEWIQSVRRKLAKVVGVRVYPRNPPPIQIGGRGSNSQYQYTLEGPDTDELCRVADAVE